MVRYCVSDSDWLSKHHCGSFAVLLLQNLKNSENNQESILYSFGIPKEIDNQTNGNHKETYFDFVRAPNSSLKITLNVIINSPNSFLIV